MGLAQKAARSGMRNKKNEAGSRRRRKRGAGGRSRCVCWPQCALCGCAALKRAHLTSPRTVSATVQNNKPKSELFLFFSIADVADGGQDRVPNLSASSPAERPRPAHSNAPSHICAKPGGRDKSCLVSGTFIYSRPVRACQGRSDNVRGSGLGLRKR